MANGGQEFDPEQLQRLVGDLWRRLWSSRRLVLAVLSTVLVLFVLVDSYYQVEPDEVGMVTRFGRFVRTATPGPHGKFPFGIEKVQKVPVERQLKQEFGFRTVRADIESTFRKDEKTAAESLMLTGDLNVATVEWIVQYKISDPYKYLFKLRDVDQTFRLMSEAAMRTVVGDHSVTELLTVGRESIAAKAKELLSDLCKRYDNGISVQQLVLQDVDPPESVKPSFNAVNQAIQERERAINEAWAEYNQEIPRARGLAEQKIEASEGYAVDRVNRAKGDAQRFVALQEQYRKAPEVTRTRLYLETMAAVLPTAGKKLIFDEKAKGILPLFPLGNTQDAAKEPTP
ncbi:MAG TPA: FtsH protease activity modulator HflK [Polyangia bacterium]|jgi:membrane protease subunit HflK|nr:FtsH protease activity modulator HflK [Polyangia bacterium]